MTEKVTTMILQVDLQCSRCYRKIRKVLSKFPQVRDQVYDEKKNTVTIRVLSCCPEKIRDKLCYKGGNTIKSIEIKEKAAENDPKKLTDKKPADKKPDPIVKFVDPPAKKDKPPTPTPTQLVVRANPAGYDPVGGYFGPYSEGYIGGPYYYGPPLPPPCYCYGRPCYLSGCECYTLDNPSVCSVM